MLPSRISRWLWLQVKRTLCRENLVAHNARSAARRRQLTGRDVPGSAAQAEEPCGPGPLEGPVNAASSTSSMEIGKSPKEDRNVSPSTGQEERPPPGAQDVMALESPDRVETIGRRLTSAGRGRASRFE